MRRMMVLLMLAAGCGAEPNAAEAPDLREMCDRLADVVRPAEVPPEARETWREAFLEGCLGTPTP